MKKSLGVKLLVLAGFVIGNGMYAEPKAAKPIAPVKKPTLPKPVESTIKPMDVKPVTEGEIKKGVEHPAKAAKPSAATPTRSGRPTAVEGASPSVKSDQSPAEIRADRKALMDEQKKITESFTREELSKKHPNVDSLKTDLDRMIEKYADAFPEGQRDEMRRIFRRAAMAEEAKAAKEGRPVDIEAVFKAMQELAKASEGKVKDLEKAGKGDLANHLVAGTLNMFSTADAAQIKAQVESVKGMEGGGLEGWATMIATAKDAHNKALEEKKTYDQADLAASEAMGKLFQKKGIGSKEAKELGIKCAAGNSAAIQFALAAIGMK